MLQAKTTDNGFSGSKRPGRISAPRPLSVILDSGQIESCGTRNLAAHARRSVSTAEALCALSAQKGPILFAHRRTSAFLCQFWNFAARDRGSAPLEARTWRAASVVRRPGAAEPRTTAILCREASDMSRGCGSAPFGESRVAGKRGCAPMEGRAWHENSVVRRWKAEFGTKVQGHIPKRCQRSISAPASSRRNPDTGTGVSDQPIPYTRATGREDPLSRSV